MATVVAIITSVVVANATQTITAPNAAYITYSLAAGASSAVITPIASKSVLVMGCSTSVGGVGHVSLFRFLGTEIDWSGLESPGTSASVITSGSSFTAGNHIVWIDYNHDVDIKTASIDTILVHNKAPGTRAGNVTLVW